MDEREKKESSVSFFGKNSQGGKFSGKGAIALNSTKGAEVSFDNGRQNESTLEETSTLTIGNLQKAVQEDIKQEPLEEERPVFMNRLY